MTADELKKKKTLENDFAMFVLTQSKKRKTSLSLICAKICVILTKWIKKTKKLTREK